MAAGAGRSANQAPRRAACSTPVGESSTSMSRAAMSMNPSPEASAASRATFPMLSAWRITSNDSGQSALVIEVAKCASGRSSRAPHRLLRGRHAVTELTELVAIDLPLELGEDLLFLFLDVMTDAGAEHRDRGAEPGLVDQAPEVGETLAGEAVLDLRLFSLFLADHALHDRVDVAFLDLHVQLERGGDLLDGLAPARTRLRGLERLQHLRDLTVVALQDRHWIVHPPPPIGFVRCECCLPVARARNVIRRGATHPSRGGLAGGVRAAPACDVPRA